MCAYIATIENGIQRGGTLQQYNEIVQRYSLRKQYRAQIEQLYNEKLSLLSLSPPIDPMNELQIARIFKEIHRLQAILIKSEDKDGIPRTYNSPIRIPSDYWAILQKDKIQQKQQREVERAEEKEAVQAAEMAHQVEERRREIQQRIRDAMSHEERELVTRINEFINLNFSLKNRKAMLQAIDALNPDQPHTVNFYRQIYYGVSNAIQRGEHCFEWQYELNGYKCVDEIFFEADRLARDEIQIKFVERIEAAEAAVKARK